MHGVEWWPTWSARQGAISLDEEVPWARCEDPYSSRVVVQYRAMKWYQEEMTSVVQSGPFQNGSAHLVQRVGQLLDRELPSCDLHDRHTRDLAQTTTQILIVGRDDVNAMFRHLESATLSAL